MEKKVCFVSGKTYPLAELYTGDSIRPGIFKLIQQDFPAFTPSAVVSIEVLNRYRKKYLEEMIRKESGELSELEKEVVDSIAQNELLSENLEEKPGEKLSLGDKWADRIAAFGGSWTFIICFFGFILGWMLINIFLLMHHPFDPYPFILLNLILSCLAAIQAPIIMMSQNRQETKDRKRSENDYKVNLKSELEIRLLHEKLDHMLVQQNQRLIEIQELQTDYMEDILKKIKGRKA